MKHRHPVTDALQGLPETFGAMLGPGKDQYAVIMVFHE